jgi:DNA polymerase-3 subunit delta'
MARFAVQPEADRALEAAAARPVHAYLFVGPPGTGKLDAAKAFAAALLCPAEGRDQCATCRRVAAGTHPDLAIFEREGAALTIEQAREISRLSARAPVEADRSVVVVPDLHLAREAAPALLKTFEEPAAAVVFVALAEFVPPELVTIASRCVRVDFRALTETELAGVLMGQGVAAEQAWVAARLAGGRLDRARLLATDATAEQRWSTWAGVPARLDGTGATVAKLAGELIQLLADSTKPLADRQKAELVALANQAGVGKLPRGAQGASLQNQREVEERHKREQRRHRTDELRTGLAALAGAYRDSLAKGDLSAEQAAVAVGLIDALSADLAYNPGELLALQSLLLRLDRLGQAFGPAEVAPRT